VNRSRFVRLTQASGLFVAVVNLMVFPVACSKPNDSEKSGIRFAASPRMPMAKTSPPKNSLPNKPTGTTMDAVIRPNDLFDNPQRFVGREIDVTIVEQLIGPSNAEELAAVEYGALQVLVPEHIGWGLALVPENFSMKSSYRYRLKFDAIIESPVIVRAVFEKDSALMKDTGRPIYVLRVLSTRATKPEIPIVLPRLAEITKGGWDRRLIVYEGVLTWGFEKSTIDVTMWLTRARNVVEVGLIGSAQKGNTKEHVRVTGYLFAKPASIYGHMGSGRSELLATKIEHLGIIV
jgi:hypothetical protein